MKKKEVEITTIIGRGAECNGDFNADCSIRVDGTIHGNVTVSGTMIVGAAGCINGDVSARAVIIGGEVNGNISAPEKTELTSTARVIGDIATKVIIIDEKAVFQGRCDMNQEASGRRARPNGRALKASKKSAKAAIAEALREVEEADREEMAELQPAALQETAVQAEAQSAAEAETGAEQQ